MTEVDAAVPTASKEQGLDEFLADEIAHRIAVSPWRKLEACFKWQKVKEFLLSKGATTDDPRAYHIKTLLMQGALHACVEYDTANQRIVRFNLPTDDICELMDSEPLVDKGG
jgi:hypothetical protein